MECKKVDDHREIPAKSYMEKGVRRFVIGKYSYGHAYGAMVGYVTEGTPASAAAFVGSRLASYASQQSGLQQDGGWQPETRFGPVPNLYCSRHVQAGSQQPIALLHLFLGFSAP